jgi:hypothetical protein
VSLIEPIKERQDVAMFGEAASYSGDYRADGRLTYPDIELT